MNFLVIPQGVNEGCGMPGSITGLGKKRKRWEVLEEDEEKEEHNFRKKFHELFQYKVKVCNMTQFCLTKVI